MPAHRVAAQAGGDDAASHDADAARGGAGDGATLAAQLRLVACFETSLVLLRHRERQLAVAVGQIGAAAVALGARRGEQLVEAAHGGGALLALVAPLRHALTTGGPVIRVAGLAGAVKRVANPWDRFYRYHEAPWRGERAVAEILPWLGDGPVLELGCGNGKTLKPLLAAGVDVVGLDLSWQILSRLPATAARVLADAARLPFADGSFGAVLDIHCTGHLGAQGRIEAAREALRVLRPGGHLVLERLTPNDLRAGQGSAVEGEPGMREVQDGRRTHFAHPPELVAATEAAGFALVGGLVERFHPGHRGSLVTRESVRLLFTRPA